MERMPPRLGPSSTSRSRGGLRPCLTAPAGGGLAGARSGRRDRSLSIEQQDRSCDCLLPFKILCSVVKGAPVAEPFQTPKAIVAYDEFRDGSLNLGRGAKDAAEDDLFFQGPEKSLDHAVAFRLVPEGVAHGHAPMLDLLGEVAGDI